MEDKDPKETESKEETAPEQKKPAHDPKEMMARFGEPEHPSCAKCGKLLGGDTGERAFVCAPCGMLPRVCHACFTHPDHVATCPHPEHIKMRSDWASGPTKE